MTYHELSAVFYGNHSLIVAHRIQRFENILKGSHHHSSLIKATASLLPVHVNRSPVKAFSGGNQVKDVDGAAGAAEPPSKWTGLTPSRQQQPPHFSANCVTNVMLGHTISELSDTCIQVYFIKFSKFLLFYRYTSSRLWKFLAFTFRVMFKQDDRLYLTMNTFLFPFHAFGITFPLLILPKWDFTFQIINNYVL